MKQLQRWRLSAPAAAQGGVVALPFSATLIPPWCFRCFRFGPSYLVSKSLQFFKLFGQRLNTRFLSTEIANRNVVTHTPHPLKPRRCHNLGAKISSYQTKDINIVNSARSKIEIRFGAIYARCNQRLGMITSAQLLGRHLHDAQGSSRSDFNCFISPFYSSICCCKSRSRERGSECG